VPVDKLLAQLDQAGINVLARKGSSAKTQAGTADASAAATGAARPAPFRARITLKRKTQSELKLAIPGPGTTVNVEVRVKRTYVKRCPLKSRIARNRTPDAAAQSGGAAGPAAKIEAERRERKT
jgi:hypothetical protein